VKVDETLPLEEKQSKYINLVEKISSEYEDEHHEESKEDDTKEVTCSHSKAP